MLNRRHIRIKVLQILYAFFHSDSDDLLKCERELEISIQHTQSLYVHLLLLLVDLKLLAKTKIEKGMNKLMTAIDTLEEITTSNESSLNVEDYKQKFYDAINDDFNSPILIAHIFDVVKQINSIAAGNGSLNEASKNDLSKFNSSPAL